MAMARENSNASSSGREKRDVDDEDRDREHGRDPHQQLGEVRAGPTWNAVSAWPLAEPDRDLAERGRRPGRHDHARPEPWCTTVPMNAHEGRSTAESRASVGSAVLAAGIDSPVSTASSHSSWLASISRTSAGTRSPTRSATTSPGTSSRTSTRRWCAVAPHQRLVADVGVQRGDRELGAVLVDEAEPDAQDDDRGDDRRRRSVSPVAAEIAAAAEQQDEQRVAQLASRTPMR